MVFLMDSIMCYISSENIPPNFLERIMLYICFTTYMYCIVIVKLSCTTVLQTILNVEWVNTNVTRCRIVLLVMKTLNLSTMRRIDQKKMLSKEKYF